MWFLNTFATAPITCLGKKDEAAFFDIDDRQHRVWKLLPSPRLPTGNLKSYITAFVGASLTGESIRSGRILDRNPLEIFEILPDIFKSLCKT